MVDTKNASPVTYHLETLPDGQQVLVNDKTGNVAITDPNTGRIIREVPKSQANTGLPQANTQPGTKPAGGPVQPKVQSGGLPGAPGGAAPGGAAAGGGGAPAGPSGVTYPPGVTNTRGAPSGGPVATTTTTQGGDTSTGIAVATPPDQPGPPGTDTYDWHAVNRALQAAGMDGWQISGGSHTPLATATYAANPSYDKTLTPEENKDAGNGEEFTLKPGGDLLIGAVNPATGQMMTLHLGKSAADTQGNYNYIITKRDDSGKIDKVNPGYTTPQTLTFEDGHAELWGTNSGTGVFEKMPGSPPNLGSKKGWNDVKQIEGTDPATGKRALIWVGTDPATGKPLTPIEGAPSTPVERWVPGSIRQVVKNGKLVYVGINSQTQQPEDIPEFGSEVVKPTTTTAGGVVYIPNPKAGQPGEPDFVRASGIAQANEGDKQWVDAGGGYVKRQVWSNGDWHDVGPDDPEAAWRAVNPATIRAEGALIPKGQKYWTPLGNSPDTLVEVVSNGNGGFTYETGPNGEPPRTMTIPGAAKPTTVTGGAAGDEYLPQRRDNLGNLLPLEKNPNWQPTNVSDRLRQLQGRATDKMNDLHTQVKAGTLSEDDADKQFQQWWGQNIDPAKQEIQIAQQKAQEDARRQNLQIAQDAGRSVVTATQNQQKDIVGPGFGDFWAKMSQGYGKDMPNNFTADDWNKAFTSEAPDYSKVYEQATAQALQHISPTAAAIANGSPSPTGLASAQNQDITAGLGMNPYLYHPQPSQPTMVPGQNGGPPTVIPGQNNGIPYGDKPMDINGNQYIGRTMEYIPQRDNAQMVPMGGGAPATPAVPAGAVPAAPAPAPVVPPTTPMDPGYVTSNGPNYQALLQRMEADRQEQLRQSQAALSKGWGTWLPNYKPAF